MSPCMVTPPAPYLIASRALPHFILEIELNEFPADSTKDLNEGNCRSDVLDQALGEPRGPRHGLSGRAAAVGRAALESEGSAGAADGLVAQQHAVDARR